MSSLPATSEVAFTQKTNLDSNPTTSYIDQVFDDPDIQEVLPQPTIDQLRQTAECLSQPGLDQDESDRVGKSIQTVIDVVSTTYTNLSATSDLSTTATSDTPQTRLEKQNSNPRLIRLVVLLAILAALLTTYATLTPTSRAEVVIPKQPTPTLHAPPIESVSELNNSPLGESDVPSIDQSTTPEPTRSPSSHEARAVELEKFDYSQLPNIYQEFEDPQNEHLKAVENMSSHFVQLVKELKLSQYIRQLKITNSGGTAGAWVYDDRAGEMYVNVNSWDQRFNINPAAAQKTLIEHEVGHILDLSDDNRFMRSQLDSEELDILVDLRATALAEYKKEAIKPELYLLNEDRILSDDKYLVQAGEDELMADGFTNYLRGESTYNFPPNLQNHINKYWSVYLEILKKKQSNISNQGETAIGKTKKVMASPRRPFNNKELN
jgi:hypothetical protein